MMASDHLHCQQPQHWFQAAGSNCFKHQFNGINAQCQNCSQMSLGNNFAWSLDAPANKETIHWLIITHWIQVHVLKNNAAATSLPCMLHPIWSYSAAPLNPTSLARSLLWLKPKAKPYAMAMCLCNMQYALNMAICQFKMNVMPLIALLCHDDGICDLSKLHPWMWHFKKFDMCTWCSCC